MVSHSIYISLFHKVYKQIISFVKFTFICDVIIVIGHRAFRSIFLGIYPSVAGIASLESTDEIWAFNNESSSWIVRDTGENALKGYCGIFWHKDLVGYCVIKAADGKVQDNGLLLSDVFIEEKYRHYGLGTTLVYHVTAQLGEDVYCRKECTGFFLRLGFVESGDGLVYRHH